MQPQSLTDEQESLELRRFLDDLPPVVKGKVLHEVEIELKNYQRLTPSPVPS